MKKAGLVGVLIVAAMIFAAVRMQMWWCRETAKGHQVSISLITTWGFIDTQGRTLAAYLPGQPDYNRVCEMHQFGPINDSWEYPACEKERPFCTPQWIGPGISSKELDRAILPSPSFHVRFKP